MHRTPRLLLAFLLGTGVATVQPAVRLMASSTSAAAGQVSHQATLKPAAATSPDIPFHDSELDVEQQLLELANQARHRAGAPRLTLDAGLSAAARVHAQSMLEAGKLS